MFEGNCKGAYKKFQGSFKGVSRKLQERFMEVSWKFYGCFKKASRVFQVRLNGVSRNSKGGSRVFERRKMCLDVSWVFQCRFSVSTKFQGSFKSVTRKYLG